MAEKKKEEKKAAAQEIPDELPSLAEDILTSGPAAESKGAAPAEGDVPDELPTLDEELPPEAEQAAKPAQPARASRASGQQPREVGLSDEEALALDDESYFGHLVGHMKKNPNIPDDFLDEMKTFWKGHGGEREAEMREDLKTSFELDIEKEMQEKVKQLKELEALWKSQKMEFERTKKLVENTEIEISLRSEELKKILDTLTELREVYKDIRIKMKTRREIRHDRQRAVSRPKPRPVARAAKAVRRPVRRSPPRAIRRPVQRRHVPRPAASVRRPTAPVARRRPAPARRAPPSTSRSKAKKRRR